MPDRQAIPGPRTPLFAMAVIGSVVLLLGQIAAHRLLSRGALGPTPFEFVFFPVILWIMLDVGSIVIAVCSRGRPLPLWLAIVTLLVCLLGTFVSCRTLYGYLLAV